MGTIEVRPGPARDRDEVTAPHTGGRGGPDGGNGTPVAYAEPGRPPTGSRT